MRESFNLLFCTAVVTCAIRFSKYGKRTLMCVWVAADNGISFSSFTYDAFVIALLMLGIALFVTEYLSEEKFKQNGRWYLFLLWLWDAFQRRSIFHFGIILAYAEGQVL